MFYSQKKFDLHQTRALFHCTIFFSDTLYLYNLNTDTSIHIECNKMPTHSLEQPSAIYPQNMIPFHQSMDYNPCKVSMCHFVFIFFPLMQTTIYDKLTSWVVDIIQGEVSLINTIKTPGSTLLLLDCHQTIFFNIKDIFQATNLFKYGNIYCTGC